jgi:hypothetical protein
VTFVDAITALSERFLSERSFELIVAPALADFQFDATPSRWSRLAAHTAVISAVLGALHDDVVRSGSIGSFVGLAMIPLCYYTFWFLVWVPQGVQHLGGGVMTIVTILMLALSVAPVIVCYWPERRPGHRPIEQ